MFGLHSQFCDELRSLGWTSFASIAGHFLGRETQRKSRVFVLRKTLKLPLSGEVEVFYKHYEYKTHWWGALWFQAKARREFRNYGVFASLGILSAEAFAWAEQKDRAGFLRRGCIVTRSIPQATELVELAKNQGTAPFAGQIRQQRQQIIEQLAAMTRRIHQANFYHNDLVWRNILITARDDGAKVWWIDCPRGRFHRWSLLRKNLQLKDLAALDKCGSQHCSRVERWRFLKAYLGVKGSTPNAKRLARESVAFRKKRWPEDWRGK